MDPIDQQWLSQYVTRRDQAAFTALVQRHEGLVRGACRRVLRDVHLAEDAFQATFLVLAVRCPEVLRKQGSVAGWLHAVATNAALQLRRSRARTQKREAVIRLQAGQSPLVELAGILEEELQQLENSSREAIVLCHLRGLTQDEAAAELGVSKATLRRRIDKGIAALRLRFGRRGLIVPVLAILWNALSAEACPASEPAKLAQLAEAADSLRRGRATRPLLSVSQNSWQLSQGILTMSRWNRIRRWCLVGCLALGVGAWGLCSLEATSNAGEKVAQGATSGLIGVSTRDVPAKGITVTPEPVASLNRLKPGLDAAKQAGLTLSAVTRLAGDKAKEMNPAENVAKAEKPQDLMAKLKAVKAKANVKKDFPPLPALPPVNVAGNQKFQGVMNINGQQFQTDNAAEFQRLMQQNQGLFGQLPKGQGAKAFQGVMNINGVEQKFDDPDEFTEAAIGADLPLLPGLFIP